MAGFCDLIRLYGPQIFNKNTETDTVKDKQNCEGRRLLYNDTNMDNLENAVRNNPTCEDYIDIILDIMDDEVRLIFFCISEVNY